MNYENVKAHIHPKSAAQRQITLLYGHQCSLYHLIYNILLQIGTQMRCKCVPVCKKILQSGTQLQCKCVPICNNLLQTGTQLHCECVPIYNNLLQFGTQLHCECVPICNNLIQDGSHRKNVQKNGNTGFSIQSFQKCIVWTFPKK